MNFHQYLKESYETIFFSTISLQNYLEQYLKERMKGKKLKFMDIKRDIEQNFTNYLKQRITNERLKPFYDKLGYALGRAINNDILERKNGDYIIK
jgi:arsenate reductase-like glutaredoxin family protein